MNPATNKVRHRQIETLFDRALGISDPAAREAYLRESCGTDDTLLGEVRQLLKSYEVWTAELNLPAPQALRCGPYECVELLGTGGMGSVYRARRVDGQFRQEVAIKFLRGSLQSEFFRARFLAERQILAQLNHPNIARLLDGGATDVGEPYLVMEFIDGEPLDSYCDTRKLKIDARLALFGQVLDAVEAAHRNLVVHRDLKPSNILVTREGTVKLLDFGTSKLLVADVTMTMNAGLTPSYASPEQLRQEPAATTTDVFSLGVVLFELLTGGSPFGRAGSYARGLERAIRETNPARPEAEANDRAAEARSVTLADLRKRLRGDLTSILNKALAYDAARRYASVASFAADLQRYRDKLPVLARRQNWSYVLGRAIRRHASVAVAAALFVIALSAAALFSARQARFAQREAARAQVANRFLTEIFEAPATDAGSRRDLTVRELLELAEKRVTSVLGADPVVAADLDMALALGLTWQEDTQKARTLLERALHNSLKADDVARRALIMARISALSYASNQFDQAWKEALEALALWKNNSDKFTPPQAAGTLHDAGTTLLYIRPFDSVHREYFERAIALARRYPDQVRASLLGACLQKLGESYINADRRYQDAYGVLQEAVTIHRSDPSRRDLLLNSLQSFGRANRFLGRYDEDEKAQREVYELASKLNGASAIGTIQQEAIWAQSLLGAGRTPEAYDHAKQALANLRRLMPAPGSPLLWTNVSIASNAACFVGRFAECQALAREAIQTLGPNPTEKDLRFVDARANLGQSLFGQGRRAEGLEIIEKTLRLNQSLGRRPLYTDALTRMRDRTSK